MSEHHPESLPDRPASVADQPGPAAEPQEQLLPESWALPPDWALPDLRNPGVLPPAPGQERAPRYDTGSDAWLRAQAAVVPAPLAVPGALPEPEPLSIPEAPTQPLPGTPAQVASVTRLDRRRLMTAERAARRSPKGSVAGVVVALAGVAVVLVALLALRSGADHPVGLTGVGQQALSLPVPASPVQVSPVPASPTPAAPAATDPSPDDLSQPTLPGDHPGSSAVAASTPAPVPAPAAARVPLTVLNASRTRGLADRAAGAFRAGGWSVVVVANYTGPVSTTTVYFAPGQEPVARRLAAQFIRITRVLPRFAGLPGSGLTVVVTREYQP